ncbi:uncharacterized protein LOC114325420 [Diabrotica virgifera virgifera]|uniref:Uncharacterized protein LOC114325420 n=1 Tax=Diabrotica virgifera virgifera TaxID=50390 RepID=A0A6P7F1T6_DIAVI|nr:uncharacterized protein LOC114325420 [Diabrotica virgifera virgifera]
MKYLYLFFIAYIFAYVSGSQLKNQQHVCNCQKTLETIYADVLQQEKALNQTLIDISVLEIELRQLDDLLEGQEDKLIDISAELAALTVTKNYINRLLADGSQALQCIIDNLKEVCHDLHDDVDNDVDQQQSQIINILSVVMKVEDCKNGNSCPAAPQ